MRHRPNESAHTQVQTGTVQLTKPHDVRPAQAPALAPAAPGGLRPPAPCSHEKNTQKKRSPAAISPAQAGNGNIGHVVKKQNAIVLKSPPHFAFSFPFLLATAPPFAAFAFAATAAGFKTTHVLCPSGPYSPISKR